MSANRAVARTRVDVGTLDEFPIGELRALKVANREVCLMRRQDETVYVIKNSCPHRGAPLSKGSVGGTMVPSAPGEYVYGLEGQIIRCPHHGWEFDLESGASVFTGATAHSLPS